MPIGSVLLRTFATLTVSQATLTVIAVSVVHSAVLATIGYLYFRKLTKLTGLHNAVNTHTVECPLAKFAAQCAPFARVTKLCAGSSHDTSIHAFHQSCPLTCTLPPDTSAISSLSSLRFSCIWRSRSY